MAILPDTEAVVRAYRNIRQHRAEATKAYKKRDDELKVMLDRLEGALLSHLIDTKSTSIATEAGTFYKQEEITPTAADWSTVYKWIGETDNYEFLEKRITKTAVAKYLEENDGIAPPGMNVHRAFAVRVRKPSEEKSSNDEQE